MHRKPVDGYSSDDLFRSRLDQMINTRRELVLLADRIDWTYLDEQLSPFYAKRGPPSHSQSFNVGFASVEVDVFLV